MNWESFFSNLIYGTTKKKLPINEMVLKVETVSKISAAILGLFYVVGLLVLSLYQSKLNIRSIELFRVRYLFVGFYYLLFLFFHLFFQYRYIKNWFPKLVYLAILLITIIFLNDVNKSYMGHLLSIWTTGDSNFQFEPIQAQLVNGELIILSGRILLASIALAISAYFFRKKTKGEIEVIIAVTLLIFAFILNYSVFSESVFPNISEALGGGKPPIVQIIFTKTTPTEVTSNFNITTLAGDHGEKYYARLIYMDDTTVLLQEAFWFAPRIYEIRRDQIELLQYTKYNPMDNRLWLTP